MTFADEYQAYCKHYGAPERIECLLCDINAVLRGKWLPGDQHEKLSSGKVRLPFSTYAPNILGLEVAETGLGIVAGDPDGVVMPIAGTLLPVPWETGKVAQVLVEIHQDDGEVSPLSARGQLARVLDQFTQRNLTPVAAAELEFYFCAKREHPQDPPRPPQGSPAAQNFDVESLYRFQPILDDILAACKQQGLATDTLIAEYGPGQFEINFHHSQDILAAADTALLFRRIVRCVAAKHGIEATFMAKPYRDYPGNGMHLHVSVTDAKGHNIFAHNENSRDKSNTEAVSDTLQHAVAGTLATLHDMQAIFAPHLNSLRRFAPNSFAPTAPLWGCDHRGAAVRIPETHGPGARLEHRISGADVNPYLAVAAILAGIVYGLKHRIAAPPMLQKDQDATADLSAQPLSADWQSTIEAFAQSEFAQSIFAEPYHHVYTQVKLNEAKEIATQISQVEYQLYLSRL